MKDYKAYNTIIEMPCAKCGRIFVPAPEHVFRDNHKWYCSWTCYNHRYDGAKKGRQGKPPKSVEQWSADGRELLRVYPNVPMAAEYAGISERSVRRSCRSGEPIMGYLWKYSEK